MKVFIQIILLLAFNNPTFCDEPPTSQKPKDIKEIMNLLEHGNETTRWYTLSSLIHHAHEKEWDLFSPEVEEKIRLLLSKDESTIVRADAAYLLGRLSQAGKLLNKEEAVTEALIKKLKYDLSQGVRHSAIYALGIIKSNKAIEALVNDLSKEPVYEEQRYIVSTLKGIDEELKKLAKTDEEKNKVINTLETAIKNWKLKKDQSEADKSAVFTAIDLIKVLKSREPPCSVVTEAERSEGDIKKASKTTPASPLPQQKP